MSTEPLLRFGIIADPQYADLEPNVRLDRHYRASLAKLSEAIATFEGEDLSFVMTLGDLIDRGWESYEPPLEIYRRSRHECLFLPGNHDFLVEPARLAEVHRKLGMPSPYYSFVRAGIRFLVIDGCEESLFSTRHDPLRHAAARTRFEGLKALNAINAMDWNAGISAAQFGWIGAQLQVAQAAGQKVIVLGHYPLFPDGDHNLWDCERLANLLVDAPHVRAYLCGHQHAGGLARSGACWFVNFKGMVDTPADNTFAIVELHADRMEIRGFGREESRILEI